MQTLEKSGFLVAKYGGVTVLGLDGLRLRWRLTFIRVNHSQGKRNGFCSLACCYPLLTALILPRRPGRSRIGLQDPRQMGEYQERMHILKLAATPRELAPSQNAALIESMTSEPSASSVTAWARSCSMTESPPRAYDNGANRESKMARIPWPKEPHLAVRRSLLRQQDRQPGGQGRKIS